jgi:hypothetical protein
MNRTWVKPAAWFSSTFEGSMLMWVTMSAEPTGDGDAHLHDQLLEALDRELAADDVEALLA